MNSKFVGVQLGLNTRGGKHVRPGYALSARNSRFLPGDASGRLWALLGRSLFNSTAIPAAAIPATDDDIVKAMFPFYVDGGASTICVHKGGSIFEAAMGLTGSFAEALAISSGACPRGDPFSYLRNLYYPSGPTADLGLWTRQPSGWVKGGHRTPTATFTAGNQGSGTFASSTDVVYTYRIYDNTTGTESAHGPTVTKALFNTILAVRLTFTNGVTVNGERGTHLRIYRSLLSEPAGKLYRVDGSGDGIALASVVPGFTFDDSLDNITALINGLVRADGEEASLSWAEWGGPPLKARGGLIFSDHACVWGVPGFESRVFYSAQGLPECYPVNFDGVHQYYLTFSTSKQDRVMLCRRAGPYMLVLNENSIFRVLSLPTYQDAGFNRKVQDTLTPDHGCASFTGADSFGIGPEESSYCVYVSHEHGPMLTNGVSDRPILDQADWLSMVEKTAIGDVVVRNYASLQELWIFYPPKGSASNQQAIVADYSEIQQYGIRVTGPIDVQGDDAFLGATDNGRRFYLVSAGSPHVYVQDNGDIDEQENTNADGDIEIEWDLPRVRLGGGVFRTANVQRVAIEGTSGQNRTLDVSVIAQDGKDEYTETDTVELGPGETADGAMAGISGNSHRIVIRYTGPTGSSYKESEEACAPGLRGATFEIGATGTQKRMSGS